MKKLFFIFIVLFFANAQGGQTISNLAVFNRCYAKLTNTQPLKTDARAQQIVSGQLDPITACMAVLNKGIFTASGATTIASTTDTESLAVVKTLHGLHASWMSAQDFDSTADSKPRTSDIYDTTTPAAYFTNALFAPTSSYKSIVTGNTLLTPVRQNTKPSQGAFTSLYLDGAGTCVNQAACTACTTNCKACTCINLTAKTVADTTPAGSHPEGPFLTPYSLATVGSIIGVKAMPEQTASGEINYQELGNGYLYRSYGGGLLGDSVYLNLGVRENDSFVTDGSLNMPRRWSRNVFHDLLCRDLPAVRHTDGGEYLSSTAQAPFRQTQSCLACHSSIDQMSGTIRGIQYVTFGGKGDNPSVHTVTYQAVSQPAETAWPTSADANYNARPTNGVFYFRTYIGNLVSQPVTSNNDLGNQIKTQDDYYICAAKRYYEYFTGVKVFIGDIGDPTSPSLTQGQLNRRNIVINLGLNLKKTDNMRQLINDIFNLPHFKDSAFGQ